MSEQIIMPETVYIGITAETDGIAKVVGEMSAALDRGNIKRLAAYAVGYIDGAIANIRDELRKCYVEDVWRNTSPSLPLGGPSLAERCGLDEIMPNGERYKAERNAAVHPTLRGIVNEFASSGIHNIDKYRDGLD